jgi:hypothetical protein
MSATLSGLSLGHLDRPISTRATQTSVDEVHTTLRGVARDVSALLDAHDGGSGGGTGGSLTMRVQIERQLAEKVALAVFYLPESHGGMLETVREVVADGIAQHQAAGFWVGDAWRSLSRGDMAKGQSDFRTSYAWYQHAYQKIISEKSDKPEKPEKRDK